MKLEQSQTVLSVVHPEQSDCSGTPQRNAGIIGELSIMKREWSLDSFDLFTNISRFASFLFVEYYVVEQGELC